MSAEDTDVRRNRLLAALPADSLAALLPVLEPVTLARKQVLYEPRALITSVHFPLTAVVSLQTVLQKKPAVAATLIGWEGLVGLSAAIGAGCDTTQVLVLAAGETLRMPAADVRTRVAADAALREVLGRYNTLLMGQLAQWTACNRHHPLHERCATWLLQLRDRVPTDTVWLTHEFLATLLGVRRESVTPIAEALQQAGFIRYRRGRLTILDRPGLETAACECYRVIRDFADLLFPAVRPH